MVEIGAGSKAESGMEVWNADSGMRIAENAKSGPVIIWDLSAPENTVNTPEIDNESAGNEYGPVNLSGAP